MRYIALIIAIALLPSCKALKNVSHDVRDSVVIKTVDSVVYKTITTTKDSVVTHDSAIGISGNNASFDINYNSTTDTIIKKGNLRLTRTVNKGFEHIECNSDSLTIVVMDLQTIVRQKSNETDQLKTQLSNVSKTHEETTVKEQSASWFGRTWGKVKNTFAWVGLITVLYVIFRIVKRYFIT